MEIYMAAKHLLCGLGRKHAEIPSNLPHGKERSFWGKITKVHQRLPPERLWKLRLWAGNWRGLSYQFALVCEKCVLLG
jgi:hypothetical protein